MRPDSKNARPRRWLAFVLPWLVLLPLGLAGRALRAAPDETFLVNSLADLPDAAPGDGVCETAPGSGNCTLRAAVQEANAFSTPDIIRLPAGTFALTRLGADNTALNGDLDVTASLSLLGAGAGSTLIDAAALDDRVLHVLTGTVTVVGVTVQNGRAVVGGGFFVGLAATVTISGTTVTSNTALGSTPNSNPPVGGGLYNVGTLTVFNSTISSNTVGATAPQPGGAGLYSLGALTVHDSHFTGNVSAGRGGGLYIASGLAALSGSTFSGNEAQVGGGLYSNSPDLKLINATFSGNRAERAGGGLYVDFGEASLYNVTVTGNWANDEEDGAYTGGGLARATGGINLLNSLVGGNFRTNWSGPQPLLEISDCAGTLTSLGANYVGLTELPCAVTGVAPLTGGFAQLKPLADNGGPAPTHAPQPGSPAVDAGEAGGCIDGVGAPLTRDQRGAPRPLFGRHSLRCDLGAVEMVGPVLVPFFSR